MPNLQRLSTLELWNALGWMISNESSMCDWGTFYCIVWRHLLVDPQGQVIRCTKNNKSKRKKYRWGRAGQVLVSWNCFDCKFKIKYIISLLLSRISTFTQNFMTQKSNMLSSFRHFSFLLPAGNIICPEDTCLPTFYPLKKLQSIGLQYQFQKHELLPVC